MYVCVYIYIYIYIDYDWVPLQSIGLRVSDEPVGSERS